MRPMRSARVLLLAAFLAGSALSVLPADRPGTLRWNLAERRVDADFQDWPLSYTLQKIASATGWSVLVEPNLDMRIGARFEARPEREALTTILSDLNFALIPRPNAPSRLLVFRSVLSQATVPVELSAKATHELEHEIIVRLQPGATNILDLASQLGGRVAGSVGALNAHRLVFDSAEAAEAARRKLAELEGVSASESNYALGRPPNPDPLAEGSAPALSLKARPVSDDSSVIVALLDTGIPDKGVENADFLLPGIRIAEGSAGGDDTIGHGPAMFETILQGVSITTASEAGSAVRVLPIDIYGAHEETSTFQLAQGVIAALENGADIINLSLSGPTPSPLLQDVLRQAAEAGVLTFAAPGNEPITDPTYPAAYPEVVAVTASERGDIAWYANRGEFVDLVAPGTSLVPYAGETWRVQGTSVATAYAAGIAAGLLSETGRSTAEILAEMRQRIGFQPPRQETRANP
jgi:hypothetical protein